MAEKTAIASGKSSAVGTWSDGKKPAEGDDIIIPTGFTVEWNSLVKVRSFAVTGKGGLSGTTEIEAGASTAIAAGYAIRFGPEATISWNASLFLKSTSETTLKIELGGHTLPGILTINAGKFKAEEAIKCAGGFSVKGSATFESGGHEITSSLEVTCTETSTISLEGSTVKGTSISLTTTGTVKDSATTVYKPSAASGAFNYAAHVLAGEVELTGNQELAGTGELTGKVKFFNKGAVAGKGVRLRIEQKHVLTGVIEDNGTEAEPARVESTLAGTAAELEVGEQETPGWLILKDITVLKGVWFLPHGSETSNVHTIGTTVKFEAKPSGGVILAQAVGLAQSFTGRKVAQSTVTQTVGLAQAETARKIAQASLAQSMGVTGTLAGRKVAQTALVQRLGVAQSLAAMTRRLQTLVQAVGLSNALTEATTRKGALSQQVGLAQSQTGRKVAQAALIAAVGLGQRVTNTTKRLVGLLGRIGLGNVLTSGAPPPPEATTPVLYSGAADELRYPAGVGDVARFPSGAGDELLIYSNARDQ